MLILHGSFHVPVSHGFHYRSQVPRLAQRVCAEVVSSTIHHQVFGESGLCPGPGELLIDPGQVSGFRPIRRKHPSSSFAGAACYEQIGNTITHGNAPPRFRSLALRVENRTVVPINVLNAHSAYLGDVPHTRIAHNHDDVLERLTQEGHQLSFGSVVEQSLSPRFLLEFSFWNSRNITPAHALAKYAAQGSESIVGV